MPHHKILTKPLYLICLAIGFTWVYVFSLRLNLKIQELAWLTWAVSLFTAPALLIIQQLYRLFDKDNEPLLWRRALVSVFALSIGGFGLYFVHGVIGIMLSVTCEMEPLHYFGRNGFINHFDWPPLWDFIEKNIVIVPGFLLLKSSLFVVTARAKYAGHAVVRDAILALVFGTLCRFFKPWSEVIYCFLLFLPWSLIVARDIYAKRRDKIPDLDPEVKIPITFYDRTSRFWGLVFGGFGIPFVLIGAWFPFHLMKDQSTPVGIFFGLLFAVIFIGFGSLAVLIGFNMIFAQTMVELNSIYIHVKKKDFRPLVRITEFRESIEEFTLEKKTVYHDDSDGSGYHTYSVELTHKSDKEKNVSLYRAYHEDSLDQKFLEWKKALNKS